MVQYYHVKSVGVVGPARRRSGHRVPRLQRGGEQPAWAKSWLRVRAMSCAGESEWSQIEQLFGTKESDWENVPVPEVEEGDEIEPCPVDTWARRCCRSRKPCTTAWCRLDWEDIEDAGWYVVQYYHVKGGEWLDLPAAGVDIAFHGSSAVVSNLHGMSWQRVSSDELCGENRSGRRSSSCSAPRSRTGRGCPYRRWRRETRSSHAPKTRTRRPTVRRRARPPSSGHGPGRRDADGGHSLGIADADGLTNATFGYQWLGDDAAIAGATDLTYTLVVSRRGQGYQGAR